jgi:4-hydroxybenzoate polyprenyltransferase
MSDIKPAIPLCIDLDGTLSRSDSLWETLLVLARTNPSRLLAVPFWLLQGKAAFKARLAGCVDVEAMDLPWNEAVMEYVKKHPEQPAYLVSGADAKIVAAVTRRLAIFTGYFASDGAVNLTGEAKAQRLVEQFGEKGFDYVGNEASDLAVWTRARRCIVVNAPAGVVEAARERHRAEVMTDNGRSRMLSLIKCLRPHQWVKNVLIFVPLFTAHQMSNSVALTRSLVAFGAFCVIASALYIFNDLLDLQADRRHVQKQFRMLAAGLVAIPTALLMLLVLLTAGIASGAWLGPAFFWTLMGYAAANGLYTLAFKRVPIVDVMVLGGLYTIRIVGGAVASGVVLSSWLLSFSLFLFLSLGMAKRYTELKTKKARGEADVPGRGYRLEDLEFVSSLGIASGYISTLVFALYISSDKVMGSDKVTGLYRHPQVLWAFVVLLMYWISRVWLIAHRGQLNHDPILFALKDRVSYAILACALVVVYLAGPY